MPVVAPRRVRGRLAGALRPARLLHRGPRAVYAEHPGTGEAIGVVAQEATHLPCAVVLPRGAAGTLRLDAVRGLHVGDGVLLVEGPGGVTTVLRPGRTTDPRVPALLEPRRDRAAGLLPVLRRHAAPAADELRGLGWRPGGPIDVAELAGRGSGLTPLGDDVLCGWAALAAALGSPVDWPSVRDRTTLLSATLVEAACRGEAIDEFRRLVAALGRDHRADPDAVEDAARALAAVGHTSGAGLLWGACLRYAAAGDIDVAAAEEGTP